MVYFDKAVYDKIGEYLGYIAYTEICSINTAKKKVQFLLTTLYKLDNKFNTDQPSTHNCFGKRQGYLYGFYKDKKSGTQWNYLYERFQKSEDEYDAVVHDICIGGLKDSLQCLFLTQVLTESLENTLPYEMSQVL